MSKKSGKKKASTEALTTTDAIFATDTTRRGKYKYGKGTIQFYTPTKGVPDKKAAAAKPKTRLELEHVYGFSGLSRQNLIAKNGKLVYFLAGAGIVYDVETNLQRFFLGHNDDLTTIDVDSREGSTWVASAQKDPKDEPGRGKDLPKIYIWDMNKPEEHAVLIDRVCVNLVRRVQWSAASGNLFVLCGDDDQTLKVYNTSVLPLGKGKVDKKKCNEILVSQPTTRQSVLGMAVNPKPRDCVDEIIFFCVGKILVGKIIEDKGKLKLSKLSAIMIKEKDKAYLSCVYFPAGRPLFTGTVGNMYTAEGAKLDKTFKKCHTKPVSAICLNETGNTIYSTSPDGTIKCWDSRGKSKWEHEVKVDDSDYRHDPTSMCFDHVTNSLYIGSKSNQILRFNLTSKETSVIIDGHDNQVWGLATHPKKDLFVTAGWDRAVKVWDPNTCTCLRTFEFKAPKKAKKSKDKDDEKKADAGGKKGKKGKKELPPDSWRITQAAISPNGTYVAVATAESSVVILDFANLKKKAEVRIPLANPKAQLEGVEYMRWSPCGKMLACAHGDSHAYIFSFSATKDKKDEKKKVIKLTRWKGMKHRAAPSHIQWSADSRMIKCLTRDYEVAHWIVDQKAKAGKATAKIPDPDKFEWAGDALPAGWDVQGLLQDGFDGTDINDVSASSDGKLLAAGDDYGKVRLHKYPAMDPEAGVEFPGHAEHVVGVEFAADDSKLYSVGGADMAIFQWKVAK